MKFATRQGEWHAEFNSKPGGDEDFPGILRDPTSTPSDSAVPFAGLDLHGSQSDEGWRGVLRSFSEGECRNSGWGRAAGGRCNAEWAGKRGIGPGTALRKTPEPEDGCAGRRLRRKGSLRPAAVAGDGGRAPTSRTLRRAGCPRSQALPMRGVRIAGMGGVGWRTCEPSPPPRPGHPPRAGGDARASRR